MAGALGSTNRTASISPDVNNPGFRAVTFDDNAVGDDIRLFTDETRSSELAAFYTLRQQLPKRDGKANVAFSDFVAPVESGKPNWIGGFVVTAGIEEVAIAERFERANDYNSILVKALADRFAEAFAERSTCNGRERLYQA